MAIAEQFAGLQMDMLIGAPLSAAADASIQLADSTADFINRVGFDGNDKVRTVAFGYQKHTVNEDGTSNLDEMKVDVPMLAIVPIPNLQVDEVNVLFDMEVKQSEKTESSFDMGATLNASAGIGPFKVSITGSVSAHQANTRSSDNSAKYHVDVRATNHGTPEGLARVLDMMAANVAPALVSSTLKNGNGQDLIGEEKTKAEHLRDLRNQINRIEENLSVARSALSDSIAAIKKVASNQINAYQLVMNQQEWKDDTPENKKKYQDATNSFQNVMTSWNTFNSQTGDLIKMAAEGTQDEKQISEVFGLKSFTIDTTGVATSAKYAFSTDNKSYEQAFLTAQNAALSAQKAVNEQEIHLLDKKTEYSNAFVAVKKDAGSTETPE